VIAPDGSAVRFTGWTELAQALEPTLTAPRDDDGPGAERRAAGRPPR
jgi:hypothetical protein